MINFETYFAVAIFIAVLIIIFVEHRNKQKEIKELEKQHYKFEESFEYPEHTITEEEFNEVVNKKIRHTHLTYGGWIVDDCCGREHIVRLVGTEKLNNSFYYRCKKCGKHYLCVWGQLKVGIDVNSYIKHNRKIWQIIREKNKKSNRNPTLEELLYRKEIFYNSLKEKS